MNGHTRVRALPILLFALVAPALPLEGQCAVDLIEEGVQAYQELHLDEAAELLRRAIELEARGDPCAERSRALVFLGSAELFRGNRDAAVDAFRGLVIFDPAYRPDDLVFPPEVTELFLEVRRETPAAAAELPEMSLLPMEAGRWPIRLVASTPHPVRLEIHRAEGGGMVDRLFEGAVGDSLTISWNGRDRQGAPPSEGRYELRVTSLTDAGSPRRSRIHPLEIGWSGASEEARPGAQPVARPEADGWGAVGSLGAGVVAGAAAFFLPRLVGRPASEGAGGMGNGGRLAVSVGALVTGVAGFVDHLRTSPSPTSPGLSVPTSLRIQTGVPRTEEHPLPDTDQQP